MKIVYTAQARSSFQQAIDFLKIQGIPSHRIEVIVDEVLAKIDSLGQMEYRGQSEEYLAFLSQQHRRLIVGYYKIIYYIQNDCIYITDIFDSRQHPSRMKG